MPVSTTNWATLSLYCRALTQRPFQAAVLCLRQGFAKYGANAKRNNKLGMFLQGARDWPSLPFSRQPDSCYLYL